MAHPLFVQIECGDPFFWNYVMSDGRLMAERISPTWTSAAMRPESDHAEDSLAVEGGVAELEELCGGYYQFSTRAFDTGLWVHYLPDASRACPDAEIVIFEWFVDDHRLERTILRDGRVIGHFHATPKSDLELYTATVSLIFNCELDPDELEDWLAD